MAFSYYLGPWQWTTDDPTQPHWAPPPGTVGSIDLRSASQCGTPERQDGVGFFATTERLDSSYTRLGQGDLRELASTGRMRSALASLAGHQPQGRTLLECLRHCLLDGGDPAGQARWKPLLPDQHGQLAMHLGGHGCVHREPFAWGAHPHTTQVQAVHQHDLARLHALHPRATTQKVLGGLLQQYGLPTTHWRELVPVHLHQHIPGPLPPATVIVDSFDRADSATLGTSSDSSFTWDENDTGIDIVSNKAQVQTGYARAQAALDLSSANHYVQSVMAPSNFHTTGQLLRYSSTDATYYTVIWRFNAGLGTVTGEVGKVVTGTYTQLQAQVDSGLTLGTTNRGYFEANGSTLRTTWRGTAVNSLTDTAITGTLRTGIDGTFTFVFHPTHDDFEAGDLVGTAALTGNLIFTVSSISGVQNVVILKGTTVSGTWSTSGGASLTWAWIFGDVTNEAGFISTAATSAIARQYTFAGGTLGQRRVSSTVSALTSGVGSSLTSAVLVHVTGIVTPNQLDGRYVRESQRARRTYPL